MEINIKVSLKRLVIYLSVLIVIALSIYGIEDYFSFKETHPSTDDAVIETQYVNIAPEVDGTVIKLAVKKNQYVKKGQLLIEIDPRPYQIGVNAAQAQLKVVQQKLMAARHDIQAAEEKVKKAQIELNFAKIQAKKINSLVKSKGLPEIDGLKANSEVNANEKSLFAAQQQLKKAKIEASYDQKNAPVLNEAKANLNIAKFKLHHTKLYAPIDGTISNLSLHQGDLVGPGRPLFVIVNTKTITANANFTETTLKRIKVGQPAMVTVKAYPGITFDGRVESISNSSTTSFSLLPSQNASGNYVAITKRFPVVVKIDSSKGYQLRHGMSATVEVNTKT